MKKYNNVLSEILADELFNLGNNIVTSKYFGPHLKIWTNYAWDKDIVKDSTAVICIQVPENIAIKIQKDLEDKGIFNPNEHKQLKETGGALVYVWTKNSYIPEHTDYAYSKALTIYLNRSWSYNDGGLFNWQDPKTKEWNSVIPFFNMAMVNDSGLPHGITPVKSDQFRITAQIFLHSII